MSEIEAEMVSLRTNRQQDKKPLKVLPSPTTCMSVT